MTVTIRHAEPDDHAYVIARLDDWWGGREMADMLPRLFFDYFRPTSFVAEIDGEFVGFLVGFISQSEPDLSYVHFIGVDPERRGAGIGQALCGAMFDASRRAGCARVRAVTNPVNMGSIAFHQRIGFTVLPGDGEAQGIPFTIGYDGPGRDCVRFEYNLSPAIPG